jgi:hypothetical protein
MAAVFELMEGDVLQQGVTRHAALIARLGDAVCLVAAGQQSHTVAQWSFLSSWWRCVVWTLKDVGTHARNDRAAGAANTSKKETIKRKQPVPNGIVPSATHRLGHPHQL